MSELKHQLMLNREMSWVPCYLKSEADKYIVEIKQAALNVEKTLYDLDKLNNKEIAHHKYKRCLANAKICHMAWWHCKWDKKPNFFIIHHWRWWNIWLELAEKFKEAK